MVVRPCGWNAKCAESARESLQSLDEPTWNQLCTTTTTTTTITFFTSCNYPTRIVVTRWPFISRKWQSCIFQNVVLLLLLQRQLRWESVLTRIFFACITKWFLFFFFFFIARITVFIYLNFSIDIKCILNRIIYSLYFLWKVIFVGK